MENFIFLYSDIFESLAIFPRKSNHGEDDRCILNLPSLAVENNSWIIDICLSI